MKTNHKFNYSRVTPNKLELQAILSEHKYII